MKSEPTKEVEKLVQLIAEYCAKAAEADPEQQRVFKVEVFGMLDALAEASAVSKMKVAQWFYAAQQREDGR